MRLTYELIFVISLGLLLGIYSGLMAVFVYGKWTQSRKENRDVNPRPLLAGGILGVISSMIAALYFLKAYFDSSLIFFKGAVYLAFFGSAVLLGVLGVVGFSILTVRSSRKKQPSARPAESGRYYDLR